MPPKCIDLTEFDNDLANVLNQASANGIEHMLCVCVRKSDLPTLYKLADNYSNISISVGIHPNIDMDEEIDAAELVKLAQHPSCIAIGKQVLIIFVQDRCGTGYTTTTIS